MKKKPGKKMSEYNEPHVFLQGKSIDLCAMRRIDAEHYARWLNDAEVADRLLVHRPISIEDEMLFIERALTTGIEQGAFLGIWTQKPRELIGNIGLQNISTKDRHAMLGIFIGDKANWGKGYGAEAMRLMLSYGFATLNLRKLWLAVYDNNERAYRLYLKLGFREVGRHREHVFINGAYRDYIIMEIFRRDFEMQ